MKENFKNQAIKLRQEGCSYSEILKNIPVAKSTLSLWLRSIGLSRKQKQRLTLKKLTSARKGAERKKEQRIESELKIKTEARNEVGKISEREAWLAGVMLYWAEGSKQKDTNVSVAIKFSNSDSRMLLFFVRWLKKYLHVSDEDIVFEIFIYLIYKERKKEFVEYWSKELKYPVSKFEKVYFKKHSVKSSRKNKQNNYHGQVVIRVKRSTNLNRKITGWIDGFNKV